jgi:site-specific DNA recombinase
LYVRISEDVEGLGKGVRRQEQDGRRLCKQRGWDSVLFEDNDASAYKRKPRPAFERMLKDLADRRLDGVVVYDIDRLARRPTDLERLIDIYDRRKLVFATVQGDLDLSTSDGRTMARVMCAFANKSSMDTSRRVTRKHLELAQQGLPVGGNRPFGYKADKRTLDKREAKLIQVAAQDILKGVGLHTICRQWNERGIATTVGNPWRKQVLKNMMLSPRLAGYRVYQGGIARDDEGKPVTGQFPPVLDVPTWEAVCAVLTDPSRSGPHVHVGGRKYLLSGIARCSACGKPMLGGADNRSGGYSYSCKAADGCGKVAISGPKLDAMVTELVQKYLSKRSVRPRAESWPGETDLEDITGRVAELMNAYGAGDLSGDVVFPQVSKLENQQRALRDDKATWLRGRAISSLPTKAAGAWPKEIDEQRTLISALILAVVVRPAVARGGRFDPGRVEPPIWREGTQPLATAR